VLDGHLDGPGSFDALGHELFDARPAHGHQAELGRDEEAVQGHQGGDAENAHDLPGRRETCALRPHFREHQRCPPVPRSPIPVSITAPARGTNGNRGEDGWWVKTAHHGSIVYRPCPPILNREVNYLSISALLTPIHGK